MNDIQSMLKDLYLVSGLNMTIFDIEGNTIASYPEQKSPFCSLIEQNKVAFQNCQKCDQAAFERVKKTGKIDIYQCYFHLYEACVPLYTYGMLTGYLMMGQTLSKSLIDQEELKMTALPFIKDEAKLDDAIQKISIHSKEQILSFASIIDICAKYLTLTNRIEAKNKNLVQEVKQYIMQNYSHDITIDHLCSYFYCSKATLINHFKDTYHQTVHQYLMTYRIEKAKEYLKNEQLTIQQIASQCGFQDANYFSKAFKKHVGLSPHHYRKTTF